MAEIDDYPREKSGFRRTEEKTHPIELRRRVDESRRNCQHPPHDHDSSDAAARAPFFHQQRARYFQKAISNEENARAKTEDLRREPQSMGHLQGGERNVHAIQVSDDVQQKKIRHEPPRDAAPRAISCRTWGDQRMAGGPGIRWRLGRAHEAAFVSTRSPYAAWLDASHLRFQFAERFLATASHGSPCGSGMQCSGGQR